MNSRSVSAAAVADALNLVSYMPIPLPRLAEFAEAHAREIWGERVAPGIPIPLAGPDGATSVYVFPFARGVSSFPEERALHEEIAESEVRCRAAYETTGRPEYPLDGRFGSIYVSAVPGAAPIQLVTSVLPPSILASGRSARLARTHLETAELELTKSYFLNSHEQFLEFTSSRGRVLVRPHTMQIANPETELIAANICLAAPVGVSAGPAQKVVIPDWELIPPVPWTWWCVATAHNMMAGFWDHYVPGKGTHSGYGKIITHWFEHSTEGHRPDGYYAPLTDKVAIPNNVPSITDELVDPATKTWRTGFNGFSDFVKKTYGYDFTTGGASDGNPPSAANDYAWNDIKSEIDKAYPCFWCYATHCVVAIGYRIDSAGQKYIVVLDTYYPTLQQKLAEHPYNICNGFTWMRPGGGGQDNVILNSPRGGEKYPAYAPAEIRWQVYGNQTNKTSLACSSDAGKNWKDLASGLDTVGGLNMYRWLPGGSSTKVRVRLRAYASGSYLAGDGSFENSTIQDYSLGAGWKQIFGPVGAVIAGYDVSKDARAIYATDAATGDIFQFGGKPGQVYNWFRVGGPGKMFVIDGQGRLYGLSPDGGGVFKYDGMGTSWTQIGGPAAAIYADVDGVLATNPQTGDIARYRGVPFAWVRIGGPGKTFACDSRGQVYGLAPDGGSVWRYDGLLGAPVTWVKIGGPAANLFARGLGVYATNPQGGDIYMFNGVPSRWTRVGSSGKSFSVDLEGRLYGLSPDGGSVWRHRGSVDVPDDWEQVGGAASTICAGWREVLATNPQTGALWIFTP